MQRLFSDGHRRATGLGMDKATMQNLRSLAGVLWILLLPHLAPLAQAQATAQYQQLFSLAPGLGLVTAMAVDSTGNLYLTGGTESASVPATPGAFQTTFGGGVCYAHSGPPDNTTSSFPCPDVFVIKLDPTGKTIYATYLGGSDLDEPTAIAVDAAGNVYVSGSTSSRNFPTTSGAAFSTSA